MPDPLRDWPALMDLTTAGAYLTLRPTAAAGLLKRENIAPIPVTERLRRWRRGDLDALVERLAGRMSKEACEREAEGLDLVIAAVERRSAARRSSGREAR